MSHDRLNMPNRKPAERRALQRRRRAEIIRELSELSRDGWANAEPCDYAPLERELCALYLRTEGDRP